MKWQLQQAKARFSEVVDAAVKKGPQIVTRRGVDTAVVVSLEEWNRTKQNAKPNLIDVLLGPGPRLPDDFLANRPHFRMRKPPKL
jgi:prevent-host-death family protein